MARDAQSLGVRRPHFAMLCPQFQTLSGWWPPGAVLAYGGAYMGRNQQLSLHSTGVTGRRVQLTLVAPHFAEPILPALTGRLAGAVPGPFGVLRYVVELEAPLPAGFDPLGELPWFARARPLRYLVLTPAPDQPTLEASPNVIGETLEQGGVAHVFVSAGPSRRALRSGARRATAEDRCPFLCMADLEALPRR